MLSQFNADLMATGLISFFITCDANVTGIQQKLLFVSMHVMYGSKYT